MCRNDRWSRSALLNPQDRLLYCQHTLRFRSSLRATTDGLPVPRSFRDRGRPLARTTLNTQRYCLKPSARRGRRRRWIRSDGASVRGGPQGGSPLSTVVLACRSLGRSRRAMDEARGREGEREGGWHVDEGLISVVRIVCRGLSLLCDSGGRCAALPSRIERLEPSRGRRRRAGLPTRPSETLVAVVIPWWTVGNGHDHSISLSEGAAFCCCGAKWFVYVRL